MIKLQEASTPQEIERRSFAIIEEELGPALPFSGDAWEVARRLVHTCADYSILPDLHLPEEAVQAGINALLRGCVVFTDTEMARSGMPTYRLNPLGVDVRCILSLPGVAERAVALKQTRAKSGIEAAGALAGGSNLSGSIVAVGNAPTALLALLEYLEGENAPPALIIGMPVGFVNAAESKELLLRQAKAPVIALRGRRGGSPLAAAVINAMAQIALRRKGLA